MVTADRWSHIRGASASSSGGESGCKSSGPEGSMSALIADVSSGALERDVAAIGLAIREGRFQRWLALIAGLASALSGLEVAYEHHRGSYSRRVMYTPVILSAALVFSGLAGFFTGRAARHVPRYVSIVTLADSAIGFYFHVRGIQRKPGGWRLPLVNMIMGPP